jgi:DNA polymerase-3 subunit delta'
MAEVAVSGIDRDAVWADVVGQDRAVAQLRASAASPVHAYLFVGPRGSGKRAAARAFAAELLAAHQPPDEVARTIHLALTEQHRDLEVVEREGAAINVEQARDIVRRGSLSATEGDRRVMVLVDFHLVEEAGGVLLKAIEEPPPGTFFVVLAETVPPELVTIASRCVVVEFEPLATAVVVDKLLDEGVAADAAGDAAAVAGGDLGRARLLATDPDVLHRRDVWRSVPHQLDGSGSVAARLADELLELMVASEAPLDARQAAEVADLQGRIERMGERGSGKKQLDDKHKRERRRLRTDELVFGLATLAAAYRDELVTAPDLSAVVASLAAIQRAAESLERNPNEKLLMQALLIELTPLVADP